MLQLHVFGSSTEVGEIAARIRETHGSRQATRSGDGSVGHALLTADLVDDPVDTALEQVRQMGVPSEDLILGRLDAIGRSVVRLPISTVVQADRPSQANLNTRSDTLPITAAATALVLMRWRLSGPAVVASLAGLGTALPRRGIDDLHCQPGSGNP